MWFLSSLNQMRWKSFEFSSPDCSSVFFYFIYFCCYFVVTIYLRLFSRHCGIPNWLNPYALLTCSLFLCAQEPLMRISFLDGFSIAVARFYFHLVFNSIQFCYEGWYMFVNRSRNKSFFYFFHLFFWLVFLSFAVLLLRVWAEKR